MRRAWTIASILLLLLALVIAFLLFRNPSKTFRAKPGEIVELHFELDKKFEFGEYYFDLDNGEGATDNLCFCLSERNTYPMDCEGDIKYIYNNRPGTMCIPLHIGNGSCRVKPISTAGYSTMFFIPLEYQWTKPVEKIVMGIKVPSQTKDASRIVVKVTIYKMNDLSKLEVYRVYKQAILVEDKKARR